MPEFCAATSWLSLDTGRPPGVGRNGVLNHFSAVADNHALTICTKEAFQLDTAPAAALRRPPRCAKFENRRENRYNRGLSRGGVADSAAAGLEKRLQESHR
jgi:hypothetical protein